MHWINGNFKMKGQLIYGSEIGSDHFFGKPLEIQEFSLIDEVLSEYHGIYPFYCCNKPFDSKFEGTFKKEVLFGDHQIC